ncbi:hypothetical protein [Nitrososphaeria virus YSH_1032793]|uniref:Uncharacterized protein n=1 Tax=Nitrososphaeria virus YSH_1032793 TaxID=3071320 RepID=A0A976UAF1_9CAUD|nr:hypothetical protein QKV91_gp65 [Yangshan Harbor Nitrososphaeria virus]UVF62269.1 hypothetical protein [Nitrososphaeria virus YSH_1032793]
MSNMTEEKSPYFSKRIRIGDVTSPKDLVGFKDFTLELTFGNQDAIIIKNPSDVADVSQKGLFEMVEEIFKERDEWAEKRGLKFIDKMEKVN